MQEINRLTHDTQVICTTAVTDANVPKMEELQLQVNGVRNKLRDFSCSALQFRKMCQDNIATLTQRKAQLRHNSDIEQRRTLQGIQKRLVEIKEEYDQCQAKIAEQGVLYSLGLYMKSSRLLRECRTNLEKWNDCHMKLQSMYMERNALRKKLDVEIEVASNDQHVADYFIEEASKVQRTLDSLSLKLDTTQTATATDVACEGLRDGDNITQETSSEVGIVQQAGQETSPRLPTQPLGGPNQTKSVLVPRPDKELETLPRTHSMRK